MHQRNIHTHTHINTCTHTHTHINTRAQTHTYTHACSAHYTHKITRNTLYVRRLAGIHKYRLYSSSWDHVILWVCISHTAIHIAISLSIAVHEHIISSNGLWKPCLQLIHVSACVGVCACVCAFWNYTSSPNVLLNAKC